jgi:hypothetical protein
MEGLNIILNWKTQKRDLLGFFVNLFSVAFLYLFVFKDIKTMGKGHTFTVSEMKLIPEFNTGGRHPIFDSSFKDGSWFTSTHWGLPVGSFGIYHILALAVFILTISVYLYFNKNKAVKILKSNTIILFYSSIILYILAQALFPLLYMPNRYIAVPWLILVILILFLLLFELVSYLNKHKPYLSKTFYITVSLICFLGIYLTQDLKIKNPGFLSMNNDTKTVIEKLPKDSIIAGHPGLHDLTMIPAITKREVFIDRERSVAYSIDILNEIRRRTIESFKMTYASNKKELIDLMKSNNVTHIIAHKKYYKKIYLDNPKYYEPYSKPLKEIIEKNRNKGFYLDSLLKENGMGFIVLSTEELKE